LSSAASFAVGAALPVLAVIVAPQVFFIPVVAGASLLFLAALGAWAASAGGASVFKGAARVTFWGALAMAVTAVAGALFGATP
jgi:vacuolar iron transporter family protein